MYASKTTYEKADIPTQFSQFSMKKVNAAGKVCSQHIDIDIYHALSLLIEVFSILRSFYHIISVLRQTEASKDRKFSAVCHK